MIYMKNNIIKTLFIELVYVLNVKVLKIVTVWSTSNHLLPAGEAVTNYLFFLERQMTFVQKHHCIDVKDVIISNSYLRLDF